MRAQYFAEVDSTDQILQVLTQFSADEGPPAPPPEGEHSYYLLDEPINWAAAPNKQCILMWNGGDTVWHDPRTIEQVREQVNLRINVERDRRIARFDRFTFNGVLFDGDAAAKENITDAAAGAADDQPLPEGFTWRAFDNSDVPMTNADILDMAKAFRMAFNLHKFTMHAIARALKDVAAQPGLTNAQVDEINWPD